MVSNKRLKILLAFTVLFNVIDAVVSINIIHYGTVEEANPIMEMFLNLGIVPFIMAKATLAGGGCIVLWKCRKRFLARVGIYIIFSLYLSLMGYFVYGYLNGWSS